jgi:hypothetical protein
MATTAGVLSALDDPDKTEARWRAATKKLIASAPSKPAAAEPTKPKDEEQEPEPSGEDLAWYRDNASIGPFDAAPVYETKHYLLKTNVKKEHAKRYGAMLDGYFDLFVQVFNPPTVPSKKNEVWIYASIEEYDKATGLGKQATGFYSPSTGRVTAYHGIDAGNEPTRVTLAHELTHQFEDVYLGRPGFFNCPAWLLEGFASFFESATFDGKKVSVAKVPRNYLTGVKRALKAGEAIPLERLFAMQQRELTWQAYAHSWSVIYMILYYHGDAKLRQRNLKLFDQLFTLSRERQVTPDDVSQLLGGTALFESTWRKWVADLPYDFDPKKAK